MPRPADVTDAQIAAWREQVGPPADRTLKMTPEMKEASMEVACAGCWLDEQLKAKTRLDEAQRSAACMANGQIAFGRDPWKVAETTLFLAQHASYFKPGPTLAEDLLHGKLDGIYGVGPGMHSPQAVALMKKAMGIQKFSDIIERTGAKTVDEARALVEEELEEMEQEFLK